MRRASSITAAAVLFLGGGALAQPAGFTPDAFDVGEPVIAHNLSVVPLYTRKAPPWDDYIVLEEAQARRLARIAETKGEDVSRLDIENRDTDRRPLYLLGGEVVLGGKQDRMVVNDTVIDPGKKQQIEVRCVEPGRWQGADLSFHASEAVAHPDLRKAALFQGQGDVWQEVARKSAASRVSSATGTYRRVLQDAGVRRRIQGYLDELQAKIPHTEKLTGLAVAVNGQVELVDLFDSPRLYAKLERKLLASYVLAALERQPSSAAKAMAYEKKARALGKPNVEALLKPDTGAEDGAMADAPGQQRGRYEAKSGPKSKVFQYKGKAVHGTYFGAESQEAE
jgi:hypothetical protein